MAAGAGDSLSALLPTIKGASTETAIIGYIKQAISAPDIYVFGELLALENVQKMSQSAGDGKKAYALLEVFCYGRYSDYQKGKDSMMSLTEKQSKKLKQLSIVSLASENRVIPYAKLQAELDIANLRDLEDLVIDALYRNVFVGKLDHALSQLQVDSAIGRDVRPSEIDAMIRSLRNWEVQSKNLLTILEEEARKAKESLAENELHNLKFNKQLEDHKANVKALLETEADFERGGAGLYSMLGQMGMGIPGMMDFTRAKPGRKDHKGGGPGKGSRHGY